MLHLSFAEHPALSAPLRTALLARAEKDNSWAGAEIYAALARNPATTVAQLRDLVTAARTQGADRDVASAIVQRADLTPQTFASLVTENGLPDEFLLDATQRFPTSRGLHDLLRELLRGAASEKLVNAIAYNNTPLDVRSVATLRLANRDAGEPLAYVVFTTCLHLLSRARTRAQHDQAVAHTRSVLAVATGGPALALLRELDLTWQPELTVGTPQWLDARSTTLIDIRAWANQDTEPHERFTRWTQVLEYREQLPGRGHLAAAAWAATHTPHAAAAALADPATPERVKLDALAAFTNRPLPHTGQQVLRSCSANAAVQFAARRIVEADSMDAAKIVASRADLTPEDLWQMWQMCSSAQSTPRHRFARAEMAALLATHPNRWPGHVTRAQGTVKDLRTSRARQTAAGLPVLPSDPFCDLVDTVDVPDRAAALSVPGLLHHAGVVNGFRAELLNDTLTRLLPTIATPAQAHALLGLAPDFTGTLGDLFDVAVTIGS